MAAPAIAPYRSAAPAGNDGFGQLLWAEWTKFRTVRGWVIGLIVAGLLTAGIGLLSHSECGSQAARPHPSWWAGRAAPARWDPAARR